MKAQIALLVVALATAACTELQPVCDSMELDVLRAATTHDAGADAGAADGGAEPEYPPKSFYVPGAGCG